MSLELAKSLKAAFKGSLRVASDQFWHTDFLPTGIAGVDLALGGGFGFGRVAEIYGEWSTGKTMLLYHALANNQSMGGQSVLFETEGAFSSEFFQELGGNADELLVYDVDTAEQVFEGIKQVCTEAAKLKEKIPVVLGWDSIAETSTDHLLEVGMEKRDMSMPGVMSAGCKYIKNDVKRSGVCVLATNQTRDLIDDRSSRTHTPGGKAWKYLASQRVELRLDGGPKGSLILAEDGEEVGQKVRGVVTKNKLASPFGVFRVPIYFRSAKKGYVHPQSGEPLRLGVDKLEALLAVYTDGAFTLEDGEFVVEQSGAWYNLNKRLYPNAKSFHACDWNGVLKNHPDLLELPYKKTGENRVVGVGATDTSEEVE
jgi:recombination protein RecA